MRRIVFSALALTLALSLSSDVEAGQRRVRGQRIKRAQRSVGGFFSNVMELERRKNAWLKATFLGR